jgi:hypothetical protein
VSLSFRVGQVSECSVEVGCVRVADCVQDLEEPEHLKRRSGPWVLGGGWP